MFPGGFTPSFGGDLQDYAAVAGLRGKVGERVNWDLSAGYGYNRVDFFITNTVNASLGPHTPTTFDPGSYIQDELNVNFDVVYELSEAVTLAAGAEYRDETFEIEAGQIESWDFGPLAARVSVRRRTAFRDSAIRSRAAGVAATMRLYADIGWRVTDPWQVDLAVRWEDFEDFGTTTNGKVATNYRFNEAVRESAAAGIRDSVRRRRVSRMHRTSPRSSILPRRAGEPRHDSVDQPGGRAARRRAARARGVAELQRRRDCRAGRLHA